MISSASSATNCSTRSTAPTRRSIPARRRRTARSSSPASSASCSRHGPKSSRPAPSCRSTEASAPRSSTARWGAARRPSASPHGRRTQCRRLPPHPGALAAPPGLQVAPGNPRDGGRCQGLGAQRPGHPAQADQAARAVGGAARRPGVLRPGARADADGLPLEACLRPASHPPWRRGGLPGLRHRHHWPRRRAGQSGRTRSRGVPQEVQPLRPPLWTLIRPRSLSASDQSSAVLKALKRIPTIGEVTAQKLMQKFGDGFLASMLGDNIHEFINLMDGNGELVFSDRKATRMERAMSNMEFGFCEGVYQPSEFIKRYLPQGTFDLLIADEAHEYKNGGSAQGQAMGVLAAKSRKTLLLTGTLMGRYGDDLFYLLFRALPGRMIEDGDRPPASGSMTSAAMAFMRDHGVLKDIYSESTRTAHKTANGTKVSVRPVKAPGFGPKGMLRCILPFTIFLKLKDIGGNVLPPYDEEFREAAMDTAQAAAYRDLAGRPPARATPRRA